MDELWIGWHWVPAEQQWRELARAGGEDECWRAVLDAVGNIRPMSGTLVCLPDGYPPPGCG